MRITRTAWVTVLALVGTLGVGLAAQSPTPTPKATVALTGKWAMTMEMEIGSATTALVFKQEADKLTGTYTGRYGTFPLAGKVKDRAIEFVVTINAEGTESLMNFWGELNEAGDTIRGTAELGGMGQATWFAKPDKKK